MRVSGWFFSLAIAAFAMSGCVVGGGGTGLDVDDPSSDVDTVVDTTAPETVIDSGPSGTIANVDVTLHFSGTDDVGVTRFECHLSGPAEAHDWVACTSPRTYTALIDGGYAFEVRAADEAGNIDPSPAKATWTVDATIPDTVPPQTTIDSGPSGLVNSSSASFTFSCDEGACSYECRLDDGAWAACTSPRNLSALGEGLHTFEVQAIDTAGNVDVSPASATWTVDTVAPTTTILSAPSAITSSNSATITFSGSDANGIAGYECRLDGGAWEACTSPRNLSSLGEGSHTFEVRAIDTAGNVDMTPAEAIWEISLTSPRILDGVAQLSAHGSHTCAIRLPDELWCWGNYPVRVSAEISWRQVAVGFGHTCAIDHGNNLYCWSGVEAAIPVPVLPYAAWATVAAGEGSTCAIQQTGAIYCGSSSFPTPTQIGSSTDWTAVGTSYTGFSCGLNAQKHWFCWESGEAPVQISAESNWKAVAVGRTNDGRERCAIREDGTLFCLDSSKNPIRVGADDDWASIAAAHNHLCGTKTDGSLHCWGWNGYGQLGDGTLTDRDLPVRVGAAVGWQAAAVGKWHSCALRSGAQSEVGGSVYCWGWADSYGRLGDGSTTHKHLPSLVLGEETWAQVAVGIYHTCALNAVGRAFCWGEGGNGQLGDGAMTNRAAPVAVSTEAGFAQIAAGGEGHVCGVTTDGRLSCWGANYSGQLGDGTFLKKSAPILVGADADWARVEVGDGHTCAQKLDGRLYCWGNNEYGQIGDGTLIDRTAPVLLGTWGTFSTSHHHTCAIGTGATGGGLYCWGYNYHGQLGDGTQESRQSPVQVGTDTDWVKVAAGRDTTCAWKYTGEASCWGRNARGEYGAGNTTSSDTPTRVTSADGWAVLALAGRACGINETGGLFCWGDNEGGRIGNGESTLDPVVDPVAIGGDKQWVTLDASAYHACAAASSGKLYCWGSGDYGALGNGQAFRTEPAPVAPPPTGKWQQVIDDGSGGWISDKYMLCLEPQGDLTLADSNSELLLPIGTWSTTGTITIDEDGGSSLAGMWSFEGGHLVLEFDETCTFDCQLRFAPAARSDFACRFD